MTDPSDKEPTAVEVLPPLPEPKLYPAGAYPDGVLTYSADQMREYALAALSAVHAVPDYLRGYKDGLAHAAFYVHDHCQQGEEHAESVLNLKLPSAAPLQGADKP